MMVVEWDLMGFHGNKPSGKRLQNELEFFPERTGKWLVEIDGLYNVRPPSYKLVYKPH